MINCKKELVSIEPIQDVNNRRYQVEEESGCMGTEDAQGAEAAAKIVQDDGEAAAVEAAQDFCQLLRGVG